MCFDRWNSLQRWINSPDANWFVDGIAEGGLARYEVESVLEDFDLPVTRENLRRIGQEATKALEVAA